MTDNILIKLGKSEAISLVGACIGEGLGSIADKIDNEIRSQASHFIIINVTNKEESVIDEEEKKA